MKNLSFTLFIVILFCFFNPLAAQDHNSEETQKAWQEAMAPGDMHAMLAKAAGEWKTKASMWMNPDGEPMVSEGSVSSEMIMGGRYLRSVHSGNYMGMPMEGIALEGYDNIKGKFVSTWIDNFGTGIARSEGIYDTEKKATVYHGKMGDPMSGGEIDYKQVMRMIDDNNAIFEMFMIMGGQEVKTMEIEYTRK